jgi:large conductance mechanosensitive channel
LQGTGRVVNTHPPARSRLKDAFRRRGRSIGWIEGWEWIAPVTSLSATIGLDRQPAGVQESIMSAMTDFKTFVLRGNVVDLAVGVVIGAAFGSVVTALVKDLLTPLVSIPGKANFGDLYFQIGAARFLYGDFINTVISFLLIAFAVFFFVVRPVNWLMARRKTDPPPDPTTRNCPFCISEIPIQATRCAFCTSDVRETA